MPLPNDEHQELVQMLCAILQIIFGIPCPHKIRPGVNVSDRAEGWDKNFRAPDVVAFLAGNPAINCGTHWCGGPDFLTEIRSKNDPTCEKLPFYASVNVREVLIVNRYPWQLELHQLNNGEMVEAGKSSLDQPNLLSSLVLPVTFRLVPGTSRPQIEIVHTATGQTWTI